MVVLGGVDGWVGWCGGKLSSYGGLRILLAKWVGGARVDWEGGYMKRQHFDIRLNGSVVATTFAWNAAIRAIERLVRERARLVAATDKKDDRWSRETAPPSTRGWDASDWQSAAGTAPGRRLHTARAASWCRLRLQLAASVYKLVESHTEGPITVPLREPTRGHRTWRSAHETLRYDIELRGSIPTC